MEVVAVKSSKAVKTNGKAKVKSTSSDVFSDIIQSMLFQNVKQQDIQNKDLKKSGNEVNIKSIGKDISASNNKALPKESTNEKDIEKLIQDIKSGVYTRDEVYSKILKLSEYTGKSSSEILTMLNGLNENTKNPDALQVMSDTKKSLSLNEIVDKMMKQDDGIAEENGQVSMNLKPDNVKAEVSKYIISDKIVLNENADAETEVKDTAKSSSNITNKVAFMKDENVQSDMNVKLDNTKADMSKYITLDKTALNENADAETEVKDTAKSSSNITNKIAFTKDENVQPSMNVKLDNTKAEASKYITSDKTALNENADAETEVKGRVTSISNNANKIAITKDENVQPNMNVKPDDAKAEASKYIASDETGLNENADAKAEIKGTVTSISNSANKIAVTKDENVQPGMNLKDNTKAEVSKYIASDETGLNENTDVESEIKDTAKSISNSVNKIAVTKDENVQPGMNVKLDNVKAEASKYITSDKTSLNENADAEAEIKSTAKSISNNANKIVFTKDENVQPNMNLKTDNTKADIIKNIISDKTVLDESAGAQVQIKDAALSDSSKNLNKANDAGIFADNAQSQTNINSYSLLDKNNKTFKDSTNIQGINVISNDGNTKHQLDSKSDGSGKQSNLQMNYTAKLQNKIIAPDLKDSSSNFEKVLNIQSSDISQSSKTIESNKVESGYISSSKDLIDFTVRSFKTLRLPGFTELKLKLKPAELGEITIKVVLEKGQIDGVITAERKEVADMLNNGMDSLKQNLKSNNITFNNINVNIDNSENYGNESNSRGSMYEGKEREHYRGSFESKLEKKEEENEKGFSILA